MTFRRFENSDLAAIREIHERAGYQFDMPDMAKMVSSWVAVEGEKVIAWSGAQMQPEITLVIDPKWGSPHWREGLIKAFHRPLGIDLEELGYKKAFANLDPKFKRFGRSLARLGWWAGWPTAWVKTEAR